MGLGERNGVSLAIHLRGKKYISVHTLVLARGKKKSMLPRRLRSGPLNFFCKEQDFLHYVLNDGDNM